MISAICHFQHAAAGTAGSGTMRAGALFGLLILRCP